MNSLLKVLLLIVSIIVSILLQNGNLISFISIPVIIILFSTVCLFISLTMKTTDLKNIIKILNEKEITVSKKELKKIIKDVNGLQRVILITTGLVGTTSFVLAMGIVNDLALLGRYASSTLISVFIGVILYLYLLSVKTKLQMKLEVFKIK